MTLVDIVCLALAVIGLTVGGVCAIQLHRWERLLRGARVSVYYKEKTKMTPRLLDLLVWTRELEGDKQVNGQVIYKMGGTTIALRKPVPRSHGKTRTRTIKEDQAA